MSQSDARRVLSNHVVAASSLAVPVAAPAASAQPFLGGEVCEDGQGSGAVRRRRGPGRRACDRPACDGGVQCRRVPGLRAGAGAAERRRRASAGACRRLVPPAVSTQSAAAGADQVSALAQ